MTSPRAARLSRDFYARPVLLVARDCIGKVLVHETPRGRLSGRIVEAEAYAGPEDRAAHSYAGRRTQRTEVMFGPPGHVYVFFVYGMHWNFNLVTGREGQPQAVLVRAIEPLEGIPEMLQRRKVDKPWEQLTVRERRSLTNGPGKLCQALGIDRSAYGMDLETGPIYLENGAKQRTLRSARIGVDYAGDWAQKLYRFYAAGNPYVSALRPSRDACKVPAR